MARNNAMIWVIAVIAILVIGQNAGWFEGFFGGQSSSEDDASVPGAFPSDLTSTITLNAKDALATSDTNANVDYYVFDANDNFVKTGSTGSDGTVSFDVAFGPKYSLIAFSDSTFYPVDVEFVADDSEKTVNVGVMGVSNVTVDSVVDPIDLNGNITSGLGQTESFEIRYSATTSSAAVYKPVFVIDNNQSSTQDITLSGLPKVTCPTRLSSDATRRKLCYQGETFKSIDGTQKQAGAILFSASVTPDTGDFISVDVLDTQMYANPGYATLSKSAGFVEGIENPNDLSNVGATDSQSPDATDHANTKAYLYFGG